MTSFIIITVDRISDKYAHIYPVSQIASVFSRPLIQARVEIPITLEEVG